MLSASLQVAVQPAVQLAIGDPPRLRHRQEDIVFGVWHRNDGAAVADTAGPPGDLGDVKHRVAALHGGRVGVFAHAVIRPQDQVGHSDVESAMQPGLAAAHRVQPAEGDREAAQRLPLQVVVELPVVVPVQAGAVAALAGAPDHPFGAQSRQRGDGRRGHARPQDRRAVQIQERAVEHQARRHPRAAVAPRRRSRSSHSDTMSPPAEWPYTRILRRTADLLADDGQGAFEFGVVAGEVGGEVRRLAGPARPAALAQVQRVEGEAALGEVIGQLGVEEVVGVAVHRQDRVRPPGGVLGRPRRTRVATMSPSPSGSGPSGIVHCQ